MDDFDLVLAEKMEVDEVVQGRPDHPFHLIDPEEMLPVFFLKDCYSSLLFPASQSDWSQ